ncbi:MAG: hypothetical protein H6623_02710 [Bdellovibrionaceae bacterium]|nr:hypothetical protein [Pseudobdellovibrionaceae bacterium]
MNQTLTNKVKLIFDQYRGVILGTLEQVYGDTAQWNFVRGQLLKYLSDQRGLEHQIIKTISETDHE